MFFCVKEKEFSPDLEASDEIVITKNNRKILKVNCASCDKTKACFLPRKPGKKVSPPNKWRAVVFLATLA